MNNINKILNKWNILDHLFFKIDKLYQELREMPEEPTVEYMIEIETKYLKEENMLLKALQYPKKVIKDEQNYCCPNYKCKKEIPNVLIEKYRVKFCPECGQRIYYNPSVRHITE